MLPTDGKTRFRGRCSRRRNDVSDTGSSIAEFALVLPVLVMIVFGIIEFGITFTKAQAIEAAAREGARLASIEASTYAEIDARVNDALTGIPMSGPPTVGVTVDGAPGTCLNQPGKAIQVSVSTTHNINIPLVLSNYPVNLNGTAVFRCEASA